MHSRMDTPHRGMRSMVVTSGLLAASIALAGSGQPSGMHQPVALRSTARGRCGRAVASSRRAAVLHRRRRLHRRARYPGQYRQRNLRRRRAGRSVPDAVRGTDEQRVERCVLHPRAAGIRLRHHIDVRRRHHRISAELPRPSPEHARGRRHHLRRLDHRSVHAERERGGRDRLRRPQRRQRGRCRSVRRVGCLARHHHRAGHGDARSRRFRRRDQSDPDRQSRLHCGKRRRRTDRQSAIPCGRTAAAGSGEVVRAGSRRDRHAEHSHDHARQPGPAGRGDAGRRPHRHAAERPARRCDTECIDHLQRRHALGTSRQRRDHAQHRRADSGVVELHDHGRCVGGERRPLHQHDRCGRVADRPRQQQLGCRGIAQGAVGQSGFVPAGRVSSTALPRRSCRTAGFRRARQDRATGPPRRAHRIRRRMPPTHRKRRRSTTSPWTRPSSRRWPDRTSVSAISTTWNIDSTAPCWRFRSMAASSPTSSTPAATSSPAATASRSGRQRQSADRSLCMDRQQQRLRHDQRDLARRCHRAADAIALPHRRRRFAERGRRQWLVGRFGRARCQSASAERRHRTDLAELHRRSRCGPRAIR